MHFPFRLKIVLWYTLIALITLFAFRMLSVQFIRQSLFNDLDNSLRGEVKWIWEVLNARKEQGVTEIKIFEEIITRSALSPRKEFIEVYNLESGHYFRSPNLQAERNGVGEELRKLGQTAMSRPINVKFRNHLIRLIGFKDAFYEIYIGYPTTDLEAALEEILSSFLLLIPFAFVLFIVGGMFLVSRFLRSFTELTNYTDQLLKQPLDRDLPEISSPTRRELGVLIERLNPIVEKMRSSMKQVLSFTSLASHELRTPLTIVRNELENALQAKTTATVLKKTIASTYDEILRMSRTVESLLNLGTMQAGTFKLQRTRVGFHTLIKEFYDEALLLSREKNLSVVLAQGPPVFVEVDVPLIRQMLFNLLDNAMKHTPEKGRIRLYYEVELNEVVLHFTDTGAGIPASELPRVFDPFYKKDGAGYGIHGAGLGLTMVKWIVETHNGKVSVESELTKGTHFIIRLPVAKD